MPEDGADVVVGIGIAVVLGDRLASNSMFGVPPGLVQQNAENLSAMICCGSAARTCRYKSSGLLQPAGLVLGHGGVE